MKKIPTVHNLGNDQRIWSRCGASSIGVDAQASISMFALNFRRPMLSVVFFWPALESPIREPRCSSTPHGRSSDHNRFVSRYVTSSFLEQSAVLIKPPSANLAVPAAAMKTSCRQQLVVRVSNRLQAVLGARQVQACGAGDRNKAKAVSIACKNIDHMRSLIQHVRPETSVRRGKAARYKTKCSSKISCFVALE